MKSGCRSGRSIYFWRPRGQVAGCGPGKSKPGRFELAENLNAVIIKTIRRGRSGPAEKEIDAAYGKQKLRVANCFWKNAG
ncbi:hypothetical protein C4J81_00780 [Deltaproteobacteria bacterium Smac51]|nr:hypothetical protein C4J81_00780 [Deltaproteobacteria bacterium Smac51]